MKRFDTGSAEAVAGFVGTVAPLRAAVVFFAAAGAAAFFAEPAEPVFPVVLVFAVDFTAAAGAVVLAGTTLVALMTSVLPAVFRARGSAMMGNPHMQNGRAAGAAHSE